MLVSKSSVTGVFGLDFLLLFDAFYELLLLIAAWIGAKYILFGFYVRAENPCILEPLASTCSS